MIEFNSKLNSDEVIATDLFSDKASLLIAVEQDGWALKLLRVTCG